MTFKETKIGIIPEHWEVLPIKEITEVVTDYVANGSFASLAENVTYKDEEDVAVLIRLVDYNNNFKGKFVFVDEHAYEFLGKSKLFGDEIIISNVGANVGTVFRCPKLQYKMSLAPNSIMVKFKGNDDFYFHWLRGHNGQQMLKSIVTGSAQPKFNKTNFKEMLVPVPPIEEQIKIASILNSIDEKIELNNEINNNLLEQLNQLFIEFSTRCEWNYLSIGEIAEKVAMGPFGSNIKVSTFVESGVPIISGNHLRGYFLEEPSYNYITEAHADKLKNSIVYPKDIVFTHAGNIGQAAMIPDGCEYPYYVLSQRQFYLRCNTMMVAPEYVLLFFHSKQGQHELLSYANQTGVPSIAQPASNLKKICLPIPPISEQKKWLLVVEPIIAMYQNNYQETKRLSILRDTLLPKLMSGELDVSDIDL